MTDLEKADKATELDKACSSFENDSIDYTIRPDDSFARKCEKRFLRFNKKLDSFGVEQRGIHRVPPEERQKLTARILFKFIFMWMGATCGLSSASGFFLGPLVFGLGIKDTFSAGISGAFVGCLVAAFASTMGPRSGLRQMVLSRFMFGWWPAKGIAFLNVITLLGWSVVNAVTGGQILASISDSKIPLEIGIVIISVCSLFIAIFGIRYVMAFESYASIPVVIAFLLLYICASPNFNVHMQTDPSFSSVTARANWLSFFSVCFGITAAWAGVTSDYYIEFPENTSFVVTFGLTFVCILVPTIFVGVVCMLISAGAVSVPSWTEGYEQYGNGGLLNAAFSRWHGGGKFLLVMLFISLVSNNIINFYSIALSSQVWWGKRFIDRIPRWFLVFLSAVVYFICAIVGRNKLAPILNNFLPMIGYWAMLYVTIMLEEDLIFRRSRKPLPVGDVANGGDWENSHQVSHGGCANVGEEVNEKESNPLPQQQKCVDSYRWADWDIPSRLPVGIAALVSFLIGIAGAILGMCQVYYIGPIAKLVGDHGADLGMWLGAGFTGVSYPILRYLELEYAPWSDKHLMP